MKKLTVVFLGLLTVSLLFSCGGEYSEYEKALEENVVLVEKLSADLTKAGDTGDGKSVAKVINNAAKDKKIMKAEARMAKIAEQYPEIVLDDPTTYPAEWESLPGQMERVTNATTQMMEVFTTYMGDPDLQAALTAFSDSE